MKKLLEVLKQLSLERKKKKIKEQIIKRKYEIFWLKVKLQEYEQN